MPQMSEKEKAELSNIATDLRIAVIGMIGGVQSGHPAGSLGTADIFATLFFHSMRENDKFLLSNGHICPILYATLALKGEIPPEDLRTFRRIDSRLQGHPHNLDLPQTLISSGPLGQGLSQAAGMALAYQMDKKQGHIYCMTSDAELQEGQTWEAAMWVGTKKLANLTWIIDRNNIQISGNTEDILPLEDLRAKLKAFNWQVIEVNGHKYEELSEAFGKSVENEAPTVIIANTIPGKGVKFMEYKFQWHGKSPTKDEVMKSISELERQKVQKNK
ncbi:MAG: transketolase [Patescibacteria group bacterium]|jgi:transketolase